jgi:hypothetical protein
VPIKPITDQELVEMSKQAIKEGDSTKMATCVQALLGDPDARAVCADEELPMAPGCPQCTGPGIYLGPLGTAEWFRCRSCGWEFEKG